METAKIKYPVLLIGPAYSGKSDFAGRCLSHEQAALVIGTGSREDDTLSERIDTLQLSRSKNWSLLESSENLVEHLTSALKDHDQVLIDSINLWLSYSLLDLLLRHDIRQVEQALLHEGQKLAELVKAAALQNKKLVIATNECGAGVSPNLPVARSFRRLNALINQQVAASCNTVINFTAGIPWTIRGEAIF